MDFQMHLEEFEREVIVRGAEHSKLPMFSKKAAVSIKNCKLHNTPFGDSIGALVDTNVILTVDYYGHLKKSRGFYDYFSNKNLTEKKQLRVIESIIVYFASIGIEDVAEITEDVHIIAGFPKLKNEILIRRGFRR